MNLVASRNLEIVDRFEVCRGNYRGVLRCFKVCERNRRSVLERLEKNAER